MDCAAILQALYQSEINFELSTFYDAGFDWKLGDYMNGYKAEGNARDVEGAVTALRDAAVHHYPDSDFARRYGAVGEPNK